MARITVLGGTGYAGSHIASEAASRGHEVTAVSRRAPESPTEGVNYVSGDVKDEGFLAGLMDGAEVILVAIAPREDMLGQVKQAAERLIPMVEKHGVRLGVIGGAGSLRVSPDGPRLIETSKFPEQAKPEAFEMTEVWGDLQRSDEALDWFFVSPAAGFGAFNPGERRGTYRTDDSGVLLTDDEGRSDLSAADLAIALVDEVEAPRHHRTRFAVAY